MQTDPFLTVKQTAAHTHTHAHTNTHARRERRLLLPPIERFERGGKYQIKVVTINLGLVSCATRHPSEIARRQPRPSAGERLLQALPQTPVISTRFHKEGASCGSENLGENVANVRTGCFFSLGVVLLV